MLLPGLDPWYRRIVPQVVDFRLEHFWLGGELRQLYAVREVGATEATIFHSARILEVLAAAALESVQIESSLNVCSNLITLEQYDLLPKGVRYWAHALRRLGNGVRHVHTTFTSDSAELALAFAGRWLKWFFCDFRFGPRIEQLSSDGPSLRLAVSDHLSELLISIDELHAPRLFNLEQLQARLGPLLLQTPVVPTLIADVWLDRAVDAVEIAEARELLRLALARHPQDVRLQQLTVLALGRDGRLDDALACLEPQLARSVNDDETAGIGAGLYKRLWQSDRAATGWLEKSHRLYQQGWKQSKKANSYLGINAAATAFWLGRPEEARQLAGDVRGLLSDRANRLQTVAKLDLQPDYWTQVTLAEALLLTGDFGSAATAYRAAFARYAGEAGNIATTRQQIREILAGMSVPLDDGALLAQAESSNQQA